MHGLNLTRLAAGATLLAACAAAQAGVTFELVAHVNPYPGPSRYADVWGDGNYAYVGSFSGSGVGIFDLSVPASTFLAGFYNPASGGQFKDVKVSNGIGYFASDNGGGLHIVDVSNPAAPTLLSQVTSTQGGYDSIHNVSLAGKYLYQADSHTPTVKVFDISNPAAPTFVRDIVTTDPNFIHDTTAIGNRLYTSGFGGKTDIYDTSLIATRAPLLLGSFISGSNSHSNWPDASGNLLASARETADGDVRLYDISNPAAPVLRASITAASLGISAFSPHNPIIVGNRLYVSWYQAGLQVIDIQDPSNPVLIGSFDTFAGPVSGFDGNWGVYPLLGADRVLLSDLDGGLYIINTAVPEPAAWALFGLGGTLFAGLGALRRRQRG